MKISAISFWTILSLFWLQSAYASHEAPASTSVSTICRVPVASYEKFLIAPRGVHYVLQDSDGHSKSFEVFSNSDGIGQLQSAHVMSIKYPRKSQPIVSKSLIVDWKERMSYVDEKQGWLQLDETNATQLWGTPEQHSNFKTFSAESKNAEKNIFHLDLKFGEDNLVSAYRVRGIGITNPQWVNR